MFIFQGETLNKWVIYSHETPLDPVASRLPSHAWKTPKKSPVTQFTSLTGQGWNASVAHLFPWVLGAVPRMGR